MNYYPCFESSVVQPFFKMKSFEPKNFKILGIFGCLNYVLLKFFLLHSKISNQNFHLKFYILGCVLEEVDNLILKISKIITNFYDSILYNFVVCFIVNYNLLIMSIFNC